MIDHASQVWITVNGFLSGAASLAQRLKMPHRSFNNSWNIAAQNQLNITDETVWSSVKMRFKNTSHYVEERLVKMALPSMCMLVFLVSSGCISHQTNVRGIDLPEDTALTLKMNQPVAIRNRCARDRQNDNRNHVPQSILRRLSSIHDSMH